MEIIISDEPQELFSSIFTFHLNAMHKYCVIIYIVKILYAIIISIKYMFRVYTTRLN